MNSHIPISYLPLHQFIMFTFTKSTKMYNPVSTPEDNEKLMSETSSEDLNHFPIRPRKGLTLTSTILLLILCGVSGSILGVLVGQRTPTNLDAVCTAHTSKYCKSLFSQCHATPTSLTPILQPSSPRILISPIKPYNSMVALRRRQSTDKTRAPRSTQPGKVSAPCVSAACQDRRPQ